MLNNIATRKQIRSKTLRSPNNLTTKQYYSRLQRLIKLGLVKRKSGILTVTSFGEVVYDARMKIDSAINNHWQLKAVNSVQTSSDSSIKTILMNAS